MPQGRSTLALCLQQQGWKAACPATTSLLQDLEHGLCLFPPLHAFPLPITSSLRANSALPVPAQQASISVIALGCYSRTGKNNHAHKIQRLPRTSGTDEPLWPAAPSTTAPIAPSGAGLMGEAGALGSANAAGKHKPLPVRSPQINPAPTGQQKALTH